jgi:hypothetical protein
MSIARTALAATCMTMMAGSAFANVNLNCVDAEKPCAHIGIAEGGGRAVVTFTGCTATPGQYQFANGRLRYEGGVTQDTWRQFVEEERNGIYFGEKIVHSGTGLTKGASRAFRVNLATHGGSMIIRGSIGTVSSFAIRCR